MSHQQLGQEETGATATHPQKRCGTTAGLSFSATGGLDLGAAFTAVAFRGDKNMPVHQFIGTKRVCPSPDCLQAVISALLLRECDFQEAAWLWFSGFDSFGLAGQPR